jgi:hypothetical protein
VSSAESAVGVTMERDRVRAGDAVRGRIEGAAAGRLTLVRLEVSPAGTVATRLSETNAGAHGEFALQLPDSAVPSAHGEACAIGYVVRTVPARHERAADVCHVVVMGRLEACHLEESVPMHDRLIARYDARRFHIELTDVDIQGGGEAGGRVHLHPGREAAHLELSCRCLESWRTNGRGRVRNLRQAPLWKTECIWGESMTLDWPEGQTWAPFRFELPDRLPPAVEARSIAWRYEVEARLKVRHRLDDVAVATPMGFELTL